MYHGIWVPHQPPPKLLWIVPLTCAALLFAKDKTMFNKSKQQNRTRILLAPVQASPTLPGHRFRVRNSTVATLSPQWMPVDRRRRDDGEAPFAVTRGLREVFCCCRFCFSSSFFRTFPMRGAWRTKRKNKNKKREHANRPSANHTSANRRLLRTAGELHQKTFAVKFRALSGAAYTRISVMRCARHATLGGCSFAARGHWGRPKHQKRMVRLKSQKPAPGMGNPSRRNPNGSIGNGSMYVCMYVCMYACMYVCVYACYLKLKESFLKKSTQDPFNAIRVLVLKMHNQNIRKIHL